MPQKSVAKKSVYGDKRIGRLYPRVVVIPEMAGRKMGAGYKMVCWELRRG